jgi:hypothetical protein
MSNAMATTNVRRRGHGRYSASAPVSSGPRAAPPTTAAVPTSDARSTSPFGSTSTSAGTEVPWRAAIDTPSTTWAMTSHAMPPAAANSAAARTLSAIAGNSTRRRPIASDSDPVNGRHTSTVAAYVE